MTNKKEEELKLAKYFNVTLQTIRKWKKKAGLKEEIYVEPIELNYIIQRKNKYLKRICQYCLALEIPMPIFEYKFHHKEKYRADVCWVEEKLILEIEGGIYQTDGGWHKSIKGYLKDMRKNNFAQKLGYKVFRCGTSEIYETILDNIVYFFLLKRLKTMESKNENNNA